MRPGIFILAGWEAVMLLFLMDTSCSSRCVYIMGAWLDSGAYRLLAAAGMLGGIVAYWAAEKVLGSRRPPRARPVARAPEGYGYEAVDGRGMVLRIGDRRLWDRYEREVEA